MKALVGFQPGEGPSRGLLCDCTTGCGTDGALHSTNSILLISVIFLIVCSGYNMEIDMIDPLVIRQEQRSYETGMFQITSLQ